MFNGIVETIGSVSNLDVEQDCVHFAITPKIAFTDLKIGDSVAVNGVCLTVTAIYNDVFYVTAVPETLRLTNLSQLILGSQVNLERALRVTDRIGGHYVQGHVDAVGKIISIQADGKAALLVKISFPSALTPYIVNKGYIGLDGMSVTVVVAENTWFSVTLIPHTQQVTIVNQYQVGTEINIEVDILSKYVEKLMRAETCIQPLLA
ncbi:MAG: riboflavin synthase subunit alpha [Gammaproteobacteria bacterium RIFCSPHIGHO2_12_FULL_41_20]|nr:MAG: riboflavin synthase subunit alpha [Gammaproteobacteria bacterium RIFCSPHIGHO2_12_FULL_41_20]